MARRFQRRMNSKMLRKDFDSHPRIAAIYFCVFAVVIAIGVLL
jgi:hypothetical protein